MGQELDDLAGTRVGCAVGRSNFVRAGNGSILTRISIQGNLLVGMLLTPVRTSFEKLWPFRIQFMKKLDIAMSVAGAERLKVGFLEDIVTGTVMF